jgi:hypothetical protein
LSAHYINCAHGLHLDVCDILYKEQVEVDDEEDLPEPEGSIVDGHDGGNEEPDETGD